MRSVAAHLALAAAGMAMWTWTVLTVQVHPFHLAALVVMATCCLSAGQISKRHTKRRGPMKRARTWACLTVAAALALVAGGRRLAEGAQLDPDNQPGAR